MVPPYAIHLRYSTATPKRTHFYHCNDGRMAVSPHTRVLQNKIRYQKKRKTMVFPPVCHTAVKLYHGDLRTKQGYFPHSVGYFPTKKPETIDLETVVPSLSTDHYYLTGIFGNGRIIRPSRFCLFHDCSIPWRSQPRTFRFYVQISQRCSVERG